ncbi:MAG: hypothetical protein AB8H79_18605 [Myxococcota bacterium]
MRTLLLLAPLLLLGGVAVATDDTDTDTDTDTDADTDPTNAPVTGRGAAEISSEPGGTDCSTTGLGALGLPLILLVGASVRRRRSLQNVLD